MEEISQPHHKINSVRAILNLKDGTKNKIMMALPLISLNSEPTEMAAMSLKNYIYSLSDRWLNIKSFTISCGFIVNGKFEQSFSYPTYNLEKEI